MRVDVWDWRSNAPSSSLSTASRADGRNRGVPVVHACDEPGAVVDQMTLAAEKTWVRGSGLLSQIQNGPSALMAVARVT